VCLRHPGSELGAPSRDESPPLEVAEDVVFNLGGPRALPGFTYDDYLREHVGVAVRVVRAMRPGSHLVHMSSAAVYGVRAGERVGKDTLVAPGTFPFADYAWAKFAAEMAARAEAHARGIRCTILRPPLIYGEGLSSAVRSLEGLAARGLGVRLLPDDGKQHLLHIDRLLAVCRGLVRSNGEEGGGGLGILLPADERVLTNRELSDRVSHGARVRVPIPVRRIRESMARRTAPLGDMPLRALAALSVDLECDTRDADRFLRLDAPPQHDLVVDAR
jgi:nucleoside-diphosphate-sugar epimerase